MQDISEYTQLKEQARSLYESLQVVRGQIKSMEQAMLAELSKDGRPIPVVANNRTGVVRIQDRSRRLPLTERDIQEKLRDSLQEKFGDAVDGASLDSFAVSIGHQIWTGRRVRRDPCVCLKLH